MKIAWQAYKEFDDKLDKLNMYFSDEEKEGPVHNLCSAGCDEELCNNEDKLLDKFEKYDIEYIMKIAKGLRSGESLNNNSKQEKTQKSLIYEAWRLAQGGWSSSTVLGSFHNLVIRQKDRMLCIALLIATTVATIICTLFDFNPIPNYIDFSKVHSIASFVKPIFFLIFMICISLPAVLFVAWRKFSKEYECLNVLLIKAYQLKSNQYFNDLKF